MLCAEMQKERMYKLHPFFTMHRADYKKGNFMYEGCHTSFDVMKEFLIQGAELDGKYQIPKIPPYTCDHAMIDSVDFAASFSRSLKTHKKTNVNFYIEDNQFLRLWNNPDKYLDHLKCFHSVMSLDFSIDTHKDTGMPFAINIYNKYRNHALAWYLHMNEIKVIPSVGIADKDNWDWCFDGYPKQSVLSVCTNGRNKSKTARMEFCEGFYEMCERLEPIQVIIVGKIPDELKPDVPIVNFKTRNQKINEKYGGK